MYTLNRFATGIVMTTLMLLLVVQVSVCAEAPDPEELVDLWGAQKESFLDPRPGTTALDSRMYAIWDRLLDQGISRSPWMAMAYTVEGQALMTLDQSRKALWSFRTALDFDPGYLPAIRAQFLSSYRTGFGALLQSIKAYLMARTVHLNFWNRCLVFANLFLVLVSAITVFLVVFVVTMTIRFTPLLLHDLSERFPLISNPMLERSIIVVLCILPLLLGLGLFWNSIWLLVLLHSYFKVRELRFIWFIVALLFAIIPLQLARVAVLQASEDGSIAALTHAQDGGYSENVISVLESIRKLNPENARMRFVAGMLYKRGSHYFEALREYLEYVRMDDTDPNGHINLGNIYFILNNLNEAIAEYRKAENLAPENAAVYFNLSKAYLHQFKFQQASEMLKKAGDLDSRLVTQHTELPTTTPNRMLIDMTIPNSWIRTELYRYWTTALVDETQYWQRPGPWLTIEGYLVTMVGLVITLLLLLALRDRIVRAGFCAMCSQPRCRICSKDGDSQYCSHCQLVFLKKGQIDSKEREKKMREIGVRVDVKRRTALALTIAFPGSGDLYLGRFWRGFMIGFLWIISIFYVLYSNHRLMIPNEFISIGQNLELTLWFLLMVAIYTISMVLMIREKQD